MPVLRWGSHVGHLFEAADELRDVLVPYFKAGLDNNERCLWVTGAPFGAEDARDVIGDTDRVAGAEARLVHAFPIATAGRRVIEVRVRVDQRRAAAKRHGASHVAPSSSMRATKVALAAASISWIASSPCAIAAKL